MVGAPKPTFDESPIPPFVNPISSSQPNQSTRPRVKSRLELSRAKHASLGGHARIARTIAKLLPSYAYDQDRIFAVDAAPAAIAAARQADFQRLAALFRSRHPQTLQLTREATGMISDLQFTESYRVPFQFSPYVRRHLPIGAFVGSSSGVTVTDMDGNQFAALRTERPYRDLAAEWPSPRCRWITRRRRCSYCRAVRPRQWDMDRHQLTKRRTL